jgi:TonB family protein
VRNGHPSFAVSPPGRTFDTLMASAQTSLMKNPIAHEVPVIATGVRPGETDGQRKLFKEEASTVLAFENGGMIRLSAAVAVGQLLFLTNRETRREVVAQVMRKRDCLTASCYVEVEFSEPSPGFWGIEFPEMPEGAPARALSAYEVPALKQKVEALRELLRLLQTETGAGDSALPAVTPDAPTSVAVADTQEPEALPIDRAETLFFEEGLLPKPALDFEGARGLGKARSGARRIGLLSAALVLVATGAAWYQHRLSGQPQQPKFSASADSSVAPHPGPAVNSTLQKVADAHSNFSTTTRASATAAPQPSAASHRKAKSAPGGRAGASTLALPAPTAPGDLSADGTVVQGKSTVGASVAKRAAKLPSSEAISESAVPSLEEGPIVPPKLINSVRAFAPPEALRDFVTGNVTLDAVVDPAGHVKSMKVLSGPTSFHAAAMDALKQYRYEPATQRGKPVAAHITVTINFWFEP